MSLAEIISQYKVFKTTTDGGYSYDINAYIKDVSESVENLSILLEMYMYITQKDHTSLKITVKRFGKLYNYIFFDYVIGEKSSCDIGSLFFFMGGKYYYYQMTSINDTHEYRLNEISNSQCGYSIKSQNNSKCTVVNNDNQNVEYTFTSFDNELILSGLKVLTIDRFKDIIIDAFFKCFPHYEFLHYFQILTHQYSPIVSLRLFIWSLLEYKSLDEAKREKLGDLIIKVPKTFTYDEILRRLLSAFIESYLKNGGDFALNSIYNIINSINQGKKSFTNEEISDLYNEAINNGDKIAALALGNILIFLKMSSQSYDVNDIITQFETVFGERFIIDRELVFSAISKHLDSAILLSINATSPLKEAIIDSLSTIQTAETLMWTYRDDKEIILIKKYKAKSSGNVSSAIDSSLKIDIEEFLALRFPEDTELIIELAQKIAASNPNKVQGTLPTGIQL